MNAIIGTAGWSIPAKDADQFEREGSALERYASRFAGVEINSSFHRSHRAATWARWAESVPDSFRFSVKMPKTISHQAKLVDCEELTAAFFEEVSGLGRKLGMILLQLPPKLAFDASAEAYLDHLESIAPAPIACEPRHPSWFEPGPDAVLERLRIGRVAADPAVVTEAGVPGGWKGFSYWRLHGSPAMYRSSYDGARLGAYAKAIDAEIAQDRPVWCMFDNTASSAAASDALALRERLGGLSARG
ncbi:MAG: DUF72 domain-containing protein [Sphingosinicella sp.]|nr:DUF72 domain-containing protein [Sphingosinicella sp.]